MYYHLSEIKESSKSYTKVLSLIQIKWKIELIKTVDSDLLNRVNDSVKSKKVFK